jgi:hypothetical protein
MTVLHIRQSEYFILQEYFLQDPLDALLVVRGCAHEERRSEETLKQMKLISEWRSKV